GHGNTRRPVKPFSRYLEIHRSRLIVARWLLAQQLQKSFSIRLVPLPRGSRVLINPSEMVMPGYHCRLPGKVAQLATPKLSRPLRDFALVPSLRHRSRTRPSADLHPALTSPPARRSFNSVHLRRQARLSLVKSRRYRSCSSLSPSRGIWNKASPSVHQLPYMINKGVELEHRIKHFLLLAIPLPLHRNCISPCSWKAGRALL
ncbi:MAG: hypothetical protein Q9228_003580, partial [Teloschistes exilis]